ncbi:MAG TPA: carboxypeptidase-like regulatory domain-containing protein [Bryobacteraceae bacterium]|nr:carboxypeptidase-like regulatory domain-containing protein [Bryobacteraceae bacterium]
MKLDVLFCAVTALAAAQDTATVEGVVVNKVSGAGIADATVRLFASQANRFEVHTDETGAFRISGVKPGDYDAGVEKSGYFPVDAEAFLVFPGDRRKYHVDPTGPPLRMRLELNPPAVLKGRVIGTDGNPARASVELGKGRNVSTDKEGFFIFENLSPGPYALLARPKAIEHSAAHEGTRTEVVPTYYPSAVDPAQAQSIVVRPGAELSGYEIRLQSVPVYRVRGVVLNPDGRPAARAVVNLQPKVPGETPDRPFLIPGGPRASFSIRTTEVQLLEPVESFVTGDDGAFEFPSVPAGEWIAEVEGDPAGDESQRQGITSYGAATFSLGHGDPDDLKIQLAASFRLSGVAMLSDGSPPGRDLILGVSLYSEIGRAGSGGITEAGGTLRLDVVPGANQIKADVMFGNYYADSILLGSTDITTQRVELTPASPPVKIILKVASSVRGSVEDGAAGTVVLFPQSVTGIGYYTQSGARGNFDLAGVPPGDYYAIALDQFDPRTMTGAVRLRSLMPMATSVKIEQGSAASVQLKVHHVAD